MVSVQDKAPAKAPAKSPAKAATQPKLKHWKQLLLDAKKLSGEIGERIFNRTKLLIEIFNDAEFRADIGARDDLKAAEWLDAEFSGVALGFLQLKAMAERFPKATDWKGGHFLRMYRQMVDERELLRRQATPRPKAKRTAIPKAEFEQIVRENRRLKSQVVAAEQALVETATTANANPGSANNGKPGSPTPSSESATPECDLADGAKASIRRFAAVLVRRVGKHETAEFLRSLANDIDDKK